MIHHERILEINATPDKVWVVISQYMKIDEFAPFIVSVDALTTGDNGVGSIRRNHFDNGSSMVEEVIEWNVDRGYRVRSSEFEPMPLHEALAEISLAPVKIGWTKVTWSMDYHVKYGPFGWVLGQTMMRMMMGKIIDANLKALAEKVGSNKTAT